MSVSTDIIFTYFPELTEGQREHFSQLQSVYQDWNARINVISRKDMDNFYLHHVLHSLGIGKVIQFKSGTRVIDVGTGGGFPGIPLAILFPDVHFHLVDSIGKKIKVVEAVKEALSLDNVTFEQARAEQLAGNRFDFVVSRAVTAFPEFYSLTHHLLQNGSKNSLKNGFLYLKGGDLEEELRPFKRKSLIFDLNDYFKEEFFETKKVVYLPS